VARYELSEEEVHIVGAALRETRDRFRSFEHWNVEDEMIDIAYAGKIQVVLERLGEENEPMIGLKNPPEDPPN